MRSNLRSFVVAAAVAFGLAFSSTTASASDCHRPDCYYKTVIVYETVRKPCVHWVIKYDHCGEPYRDRVVTYKLVQVPVEKRIKVCF
jgi:hypothetical protein